MKYVLLVSHGTFAPGLKNALGMLLGEREDLLAVSLENGMGADQFAGRVEAVLPRLGKEDELILFADIVGGSPLTTAANVIGQNGLLEQTTMVGGMNLPLVLSAMLSKDTADTKSLLETWIGESREQMKVFQVEAETSEEDI